jgi:glycosyltransferase involved in cell wall biosynthesis
MPNPSLAVCLITGNEERLIHRALDAAFSVTSLVVVVRAVGGQKPDSTLDVARRRGCIVGEYHNSPATAGWAFVDDFASARNQAFRLGMEAGADWLMWMDCDDTLPEGMGEIIRKAIKETEEDWILAEYLLPHHGKSVWRERIFRTGTAAWFNGVHEKCVPVTKDPNKDSLKVRVRKDIKIVHEPEGAKTGSQERNINILRWRYQEAQHLAFYLHYEYFLLGKRDEAVRYGLEALRLQDLCGVYRYEVLINLALLAEKNDQGQDLCQRAIALCPTRREAHNTLTLLQMDAGQTEAAIRSATHALTLPVPKMPEWTHRPDCYGWKGTATLAWAHRLAGNEDKAREIESAMLKDGGSPRISLLHATRGRWSQALRMMNTWMARAANAFHVEHIFAIDEDDEESLKHLSRFRHIVVPAGGYSVAAWNAAAVRSTGDIIVQMSDDFMAPPDWDKSIIYALGDSLFTPAVLRVKDGYRNDGLITIAIVTRCWLWQEGTLFDPAFRNVYSDNDLTSRAIKAKAVVEAPHLVFEHLHPDAGKATRDEIYARGNDPAEYERAKQIYERKHSKLV